MKVVGSGSPSMLTVRAKPSEVKLLRDLICDRRADVVSAITGAHAKSRREDEDLDGREVEQRHDELFLITRLLEGLRKPVSPDQPRELAAPTWLLDPIIRNAAAEAAERLSEAVDIFRSDSGRLTADELRATLDTACASTSTLIGLDHAQNHAVE